jgi:hypothetical protein
MYPQKSQVPTDLFGVVVLVAQALSPASNGDWTPLGVLAKGLSDAGRGLARAMRGWLDQFDRWLWAVRQREVEAYLAQATDVFDLEARIRALERDFPRPYY